MAYCSVRASAPPPAHLTNIKTKINRRRSSLRLCKPLRSGSTRKQTRDPQELRYHSENVPYVLYRYSVHASHVTEYKIAQYRAVFFPSVGHFNFTLIASHNPQLHLARSDSRTFVLAGLSTDCARINFVAWRQHWTVSILLRLIRRAFVEIC